jgi:dTMP kinase
MFITFEGLDFSGKTTQARLLIETLRNAGHTVLFLREPGGTRISERVREILLDRSNAEMADITELLLFSASRAQLVHEVIRPALGRGEVVVCDRYYDSTTAYQGYGRGGDLEAIRHINRIATGGLPPDLTLFIDIDLDEIQRRKTAAGLSFDRMESSGRVFYERVRKGFHELAAAESGRVVTLNGMAPVDRVAQDVRTTVAPYLAGLTTATGGAKA